MKKAFWILGIGLILSFKTMAQDRVHYLSLSPAFISFNKGEQTGMALSFEYVNKGNRYFAYGGEISTGFGIRRVEYTPILDVSTVALDINGYLLPLNSSKHQIWIGVGISLDYTTKVYSQSEIIPHQEDQNTTSVIYILEPVYNVQYNYRIKEKYFFGISANARDWRLYQYKLGISAGIII